MSTLTVGPGAQYATISSAVTASNSGDTIDVAAGTYTNDFIGITHNLKLQAVGGTVNLVATAQPPNGKGIIDEGGPGVAVSISGFDISGATVPDNNGAGIRYEGGTLLLDGDTIHNNQNGLLANPDPNGAITINASNFNSNGAGDGYTHNIYVNDIASLTVQNSSISNANVGHDIKSRAENTTITGNTITDGTGNASYEIDLPNGGATDIEGNFVQKGANAQNPIAISYGEEGGVYPNSNLKVAGNTLVNEDASPSSTAVKNATSAPADVSNNTLYGWSNLTAGAVSTSGNTIPNTKPTAAVTTVGTSPVVTNPVPTPVPTPSPVPAPAPAPSVTVGTGPDTIGLQMSEDAYQGDAQFAVTVDGNPVADAQTVTAQHGQGTQNFSINGDFGPGPHDVGVSFLNDASDGPTLDRNLYVDNVSLNGVSATQPSSALYSNDTAHFDVPTAGGAPTPAGDDTVRLNLSEDAYAGDAQAIVSIDGKAVGEPFSVTASHALGLSQAMSFAASLGTGEHTLGVQFLNDAYDGDGMDRNLYVDSIDVNGTDLTGTASLFNNGTTNFTIPAGIAASASGTVDPTIIPAASLVSKLA
jgi:hypothetical protein